jgi:hypothetical protein
MDGHQHNNYYLNLAWRPRWYAWKYRNQFSRPIPHEYRIPIANQTTKVRYPSTMLAGMADGILWESVYNSALSGRGVFPTGDIYTLI